MGLTILSKKVRVGFTPWPAHGTSPFPGGIRAAPAHPRSWLRRLELHKAQAQRVRDDGDGGRAHRGRADDRTEQQAEREIEDPRGERDAGGLHRDIPPGAHRDTDIGRCERRRIVDA